MKYIIFGKKINIDDALIKKYEQSIGQFTEVTAQYLAEISDLNDNSSSDILEKEITQNLKQEIYIYENISEVNEAINQYESDKPH